VAAADHQGRRKGKGLELEFSGGRFLIQVRPPGAQLLDMGLGSACAIRSVHREENPRTAPVPLVQVGGEAGQAPEQRPGQPWITAAFHIVEDLESQGPVPGLLDGAAQEARQEGQGVVLQAIAQGEIHILKRLNGWAQRLPGGDAKQGCLSHGSPFRGLG
jgi:hypothetical protein